MYLSLYIAIGTFATFISAYPALSLFKRQSGGSGAIKFNIQLCQDYQGSVCTTFGSYVPPIVDSNLDETVASNYAVEFDMNIVNGISAISIDTGGVSCTFGDQVLTVGLNTIICGGDTATVTQSSGQINIGTTPLNDQVKCFYCWAI